MPLKIARSVGAAKLIRDETFRAKWLRLYQACPWATAAQSPGFIASWYEAYKDQYSPLLVCELSEANELIGLLAVAVGRSGQAVLPGAHQAEYKGWLALRRNGARFLQESLRLLSNQTKIGALLFRYIPPGAPLDGVVPSSRFPWTCEAETSKRPIVPLASAERVAEYAMEKTNKTIKNSLNRLKRMSDVRLERIRKTQELAPIFDQLIDWYDVRQEMAHGKRPFQTDKRKKAWHLELLEQGVLHVTVLKVGETVISAVFGLIDGKTYSLMMSMFHPAYARYSPIALHHLSLVERLHAEGYALLDLTPGPDPFKERFASAYEDVQVLAIYFKQREWIKAKVRRHSEAIAKGVLSIFGVAPESVGRSLQRLQLFLKLKRASREEGSHMPEPV